MKPLTSTDRKLTILDCTLRDGGYYNDWDFPVDLARKLVTALERSGVDIVEVGYKSPNTSRYFGPFKYSPDSQLGFLRDRSGTQFAFMLDAKEFVEGSNLNTSALEQCIPPANTSPFTWCRVATHVGTVPQAMQIVHWLTERGYRTGFNLMGMSLLETDEVRDTLQRVTESPTEVFYFADSFGSMLPDDIRKAIDLVRSAYPGEVGVHTHDNQGLAFANTLAAIEAGASFIDGTVTGMGRGAGNLKLEQLLLSLHMQYGRTSLDPTALLDIIHEDFEPMQARYGWGWNIGYMLSGLQNIHPSYTQKLKSDHRYTLKQVAEILSEISPALRSKFAPTELDRSRNRVLQQRQGDTEPVVKLPRHRPCTSDEILIVASGPSVVEHAPALRDFIADHSPRVIECNNSGVLGGVPRSVAVLNRVRLQELHQQGAFRDESIRSVIVGSGEIPQSMAYDIFTWHPVEVQSRTFTITDRGATLPSYVVGMFAVAIALLEQPQRIWIAGFDGFADPRKADLENEMQDFWALTRSNGVLQGTELLSLLPTRYDLPVRSLYSLL